MINFQRIINEYKENKRIILTDTEERISFIIEELLRSGKCFYGFSQSISFGMLVTGMEKDLGKEIPLLRKTKEKMRDAKEQYQEEKITLTVKNLREAKKYLKKFREKELEKILKTALKKSLKKVQL